MPNKYGTPRIASGHLLHFKRRKSIPKEINSAPSRKKSEYLSLCVLLLSLFGTFLSLLGYGVSLSLGEVGIPPESVFTSPFEVIGLSIWAVLQFFSNLDIAQFWSPKTYAILLTQLWSLPIFLCIGFGIAILTWKIEGRYASFKVRHPRLVRWSSLPNKNDGTITIYAKGAAGSLFLWLVTPAVLLLPCFMLVAIPVLLSSIPILGYNAGRLHIDKDVIKPRVCSPIKTHEQRMKRTEKVKSSTDYATCVVVKTDRMPDGVRGRVVFNTSSSIVLFDPLTGTATRIPIRDTIIQTIDTL